MSTSFILNASRFVACLLLAAMPSLHGADESCEGIAKDVSSAVSKEPGKVLMIVEDALVINEGCANAIIKAAILASKADAALVNQIVQTGTSVAPKMTAAIMDAAASAAPGADLSGVAVVSAPSGKSAKSPLPVVPPRAEDDFVTIPSSIRGVYLMQPPPGGFLPRDPRKRPCDQVCVSPTQHVPYYP
ncbi:MAG: hypothetical protein LDL31_00385 [Prosthecobacter sp.]|jgi:hypothetical protein|nr:hypothetical protein [Prosthecobacter sp.]